MQAIILAAGKGTRFLSDKTKVLQEIKGKIVVQYVLDLANSVGATGKIIVIGYQGDEVIKALQDNKNVTFVWQHQQLGTGHAVMSAKEQINQKQDIIILYGDTPATKKDTLKDLIKEHQENKNTLTLLTAELEDPKWYGRILRDSKRRIIGVKEAKDCLPKELEIKEINSGIMIIKGDFLAKSLKKLKTNNVQREYYLTDIVQIAVADGKKVGSLMIHDENQIKGINSLEELEEMRHILNKY